MAAAVGIASVALAALGIAFVAAFANGTPTWSLVAGLSSFLGSVALGCIAIWAGRSGKDG